jgi:GT2 family glycosyltransferase
VLNWNGWRDTIECLESVFRLDYPNYKVVVCDNASSDGSLDRIRWWARGEIKAEVRNPALAALINPPISKPIPFAEVEPTTAGKEAGESATRLLLIQTGANLGFAGGNNVGLRYALKQGDCSFAWILNNDTVVRPDALSQLVQRMRERADAGICGSTLLYYDDPSKVQACGGSVYNRWIARSGNIGNMVDASHLPETQEVERKMAYVVGASMLVRQSFMKQVGLMDEQYFLTFEEIDWATWAKGRFQLAYSRCSIIYHKEGASTGSHRLRSRRSPLIEFYAIRNRVLFTRRHHPLALLSVLCVITMSALYRLMNWRWRSLGALIRGVVRGLTMTDALRKQQP